MASASENGIIYEFDGFQLIPGESLLLRHGQQVPLNHKALRVLAFLLERNGHLVPKSEIMETVWADAFVEEGSLTKAIWMIRHALEDASKEKFVQTVPRRGYRFVYPVRVATGHSGAFSRVKLQGEVENENSTVSPDAARGLAGAGKNDISAVPDASDLKRLWSIHQRSALAGIFGIVAVTAFFGFSGFFRRSSADTPRSIVVLPVAPISPAERNDLYVFGVAEALIDQLLSADGLAVRPLSSVREYAETTKDPVRVGVEQKADYVLASNYQVADGKIKVTAQLYNVRGATVEYTLQKQTSAAEVFKAQDEIAADLGGSLMQHLGVSTLRPVKPRGTANGEAYLAFIQGMYLLDRQNPGATNKEASALDVFERVVSLDPNYAKAWAALAMANNYAAITDEDRSREHYGKAKEAINKALSIDPTESLAYSALCHQRLFDDWNYAEAEVAGRRAVELDPSSPTARSEYATVLVPRERFDEAIDHLKRAMQMEPTSFRVQAYYANALYASRHYAEAEAQYKRLVELNPERKGTYWWLVQVMEAQGKQADAVEWTIRLMATENMGEDAIKKYKAAYERGGYKEALGVRADQKIMGALAYVQLGDKDKAFEALEKQYQRHGYHLAVFGMVDPQFDPLRSDPRWADLVRRVRGE